MLLSDSQKWLVLAAIILFGWLFYLLSPILMPFFVGALLAYLGDPSADLLERWGASRVMAVVMVFLMMTVTFVVLVLVLLPVVQGQVGLLMDALPGYLEWGNATMAPWFEENFGYSAEQFDLSALSGWLTENWSQAGGVAAGIAATLSRSGGFLLTWVANLLLIPVVT
ncbi:MAG TPA: AI-2E family transporter, partial [Gammaproteobacteria bacterium]|nr:AI-2E family transporter [Gammaproteobacteria bacterium]